ncbi:glycosyltransferase [Belliella sp. R4-6]|uniref:Glycosyltransferase n=1 Tax=Belliella alkalica TaxID=1730871 RepID=A0ABS9V7L0_9BACT|nr:glycosyltransferase [Belliella alkalica]MCH7412399.1 glycosyltransferase [Belliella alkalica]
MKILHLIKSLGRGGAEKLILETAAVHQESFEFSCIHFYHREGNIVEEMEQVGINVSFLPSSNLGLFKQISPVRKYVIDNKIDLIHAHLPWAGILGRFVVRGLDIPLVYTEHNTWDRYKKITYWANRLTFKKQDVAIAVSNEVALSFRLNSFFSPFKIEEKPKLKLIQNGVNTDKFLRNTEEGSRIRKSLSIPEGAFVIGNVAVFRVQKRLWIWVEQALEILKSAPEVHFVLVGAGPWKEKIEKQIEDSGKRSNFHLVGLQKDVLPFLSMMDTFMISSEYEGLPVAMLEAMSCEVPVVSTAAGGIAEVISHGGDGFVCEVDEYQELAGFALKLINDPTTHQEMSKSARRKVVDLFSLQKMVLNLEEVYSEFAQTETKG